MNSSDAARPSPKTGASGSRALRPRDGGHAQGHAAGLDRDRKTQLVVMLQQAKLLAGVYAQEMKARFQPTAAEIDAYIAAHPEYDTKAERAKIEGYSRASARAKTS